MDTATSLAPRSAEHRRHARLDIALAVSYAVRKDGDGEASEMAETLSSDISASGLRLMTVAPLDNGALLSLEINLPEEAGGDVPIRAQGEVVWQNKISEYSYETGTVIKNMEERDKSRLMSFVFDQIARMVGIGTSEMSRPTDLN